MRILLWCGIALICAVTLVCLAVLEFGRFDYWIRHDTNAGSIAQAYAGLLSVILGIILASITAYYAFLTRSMNATAHAQLAAATFPSLTFEFGEQKINLNRVAIEIVIRNKGASAIKITECVFGGMIEISGDASIGDHRIRSVRVSVLESVFIAAGETATAVAPLEMIDGSPLAILNCTRKFMLRLNCTDIAGRAEHSFIRRGDGNVVYRSGFSRDDEA